MPLPSPRTIVAQVIQHLQLHPDQLGVEPIPIAPETLSNLTLSDGRVLPPSLQLWLSFDSSSLALVSNHRLRSTSLAEAGGPAFDTLERLLLPDRIYNLQPNGGDSIYFMYAGEPDEDEEYPIFVLDVDDRYYVELCAPNFAVWLASLHQIAGLELSRGGPTPVGFSSLTATSDLAALMQKQSRLNFNDYRYCEVYGSAISANGEQTQWCTTEDLMFDLKARGFDDETISGVLRNDSRG